MLALPLLDQAFIVGPGFSPVPAKIVPQIVAGKFIDLSELLAVNLVQKDPEPQLLLAGQLVLTSQLKRQRRCIEDIASWMEASAIFFSHSGSPFSSLLEGFDAVPAFDLAYIPPFFQTRVARL